MKNIQNQFGAILLFVMLFVTSASAIGTSSPIFLSPAQKQLMYRDIPQGNPDLNTLVAEYRQVMENAVKTSGGNMQKVVDALNAYTKSKYPDAKLLTLEDVDKVWADCGFASEEKSGALYLSILQKNNKLTKGEADFLLGLDAKIVAANDYKTALDAVKKAQTDLASSNLTKEEKDKLSQMLNFFAANYAYVNNNAKAGGETCEECLRRSFWVQLIFAGVAFTACMVLTLGVGSIGCVALALGVSAASVFINCPQCYVPPPVPCKICPKDFPYDGANCYSGICAPPGTVPFIYANNFYYTAKQPNNQCPIGQFYDGANCYKMPVPAGHQPFILNRCYYTKPKCN